jgi:hypothetical protein
MYITKIMVIALGIIEYLYIKISEGISNKIGSIHCGESYNIEIHYSIYSLVTSWNSQSIFSSRGALG